MEKKKSLENFLFHYSKFNSKIILTGEHAVIYGSELLALSYNKRNIELFVYSSSNNSDKHAFSSEKDEGNGNEVIIKFYSFSKSYLQETFNIESKSINYILNYNENLEKIEDNINQLEDLTFNSNFNLKINEISLLSRINLEVLCNELVNNAIKNIKELDFSYDFEYLIKPDVLLKIQSCIISIKEVLLNSNKSNTDKDNNIDSNKNNFLLCTTIVFSLLSSIIKILSNKEFDEIYKSLVKNFINFTKMSKFTLIIISNVPQGYGMGSSACYSCNLSNYFYKVFNMSLKEYLKTNIISNSENIYKAFESNQFESAFSVIVSLFSETYFHSKTTGGDIISVRNNSVTLFKNIANYKTFSIEALNNFLKIYSINIIFIKERTASSLIIKASNNLNSINIKDNDGVEEVKTTISTLSNLILNYSEEFSHEDLKKLVNKNQAFLKNLGVSTDEIDSIIEKLSSNGIPTKITGAGGGGCLISFVLKNKEEEYIKICKEMSLNSEKAF